MSGPDGFEEFVAGRRQALLRTAYLLTGQREDAEDLVQIALVKAAGSWSRINGDPEPYVRTILTRESISRWRRRRWREVSTDRPLDRAHGDGSAGIDDADEMRRALLLLPDRQRAVVVLRFYDDLSVAATAEVLRISEGTVKSQTHAALTSLRLQLSEEGLGVLVGE